MTNITSPGCKNFTLNIKVNRQWFRVFHWLFLFRFTWLRSCRVLFSTAIVMSSFIYSNEVRSNLDTLGSVHNVVFCLLYLHSMLCVFFDFYVLWVWSQIWQILSGIENLANFSAMFRIDNFIALLHTDVHRLKAPLFVNWSVFSLDQWQFLLMDAIHSNIYKQIT